MKYMNPEWDEAWKYIGEQPAKVLEFLKAHAEEVEKYRKQKIDF